MKAGSAQAESCCVYIKSEKIMQHMHGIIPKLFDCWTDPVVHLPLLKSSTDGPIRLGSGTVGWHSGHFRHQRPMIRVHILAGFYLMLTVLKSQI